jgi:hypothetical protein
MPKLYLYLNGGLGNQMFQYATGSALAKRTGSQLILDCWSGFVRDKQYKRFFELDNLPICANEASFTERLPIWFFRLDKKYNNIENKFIQKKIYGNFLVENRNNFIPDVIRFKNDSKTWLVGYWQSHLYFEDYSETISRELQPPPPLNQKYLEIGKKLEDCESVAIGIRLYEESNNPYVHMRDGVMKSANDVNSAISRLQSVKSNLKFFIFSSKRSSFLDKLHLPKNSEFLTKDDGIDGTLETLWLLTQAKHHIFTCSSFYWWGAWLSKYNQNNYRQKQFIFTGDNYLNADALLPEWNKF